MGVFFYKFYSKILFTKKFNIDKRKAHLSCKICSGNLSRDNALEILNREPYLNKLIELKDLNFFLNKIGFKKMNFLELLSQKIDIMKNLIIMSELTLLLI